MAKKIIGRLTKNKVIKGSKKIAIFFICNKKTCLKKQV